MVFESKLKPDIGVAARALGYGDTKPDAQTLARLTTAATQLEKAATPRLAYRRFALSPGCRLGGTSLVLQGKSIAKHLAGCDDCLLLAVTLGDGVERSIRTAEAFDMQGAVLQDALASTLVEQYADAAQALLEKEAAREGRYMTARFSPGYGDLPLAHQRDILRLLDTQRAIGLSVSPSGIMLPRKSITAILGLADHPVSGHLAGCEECALKDKCNHSDGRPLCKRRF